MLAAPSPTARAFGLPSRAMPRTDELLAHLDGILHSSRFRDYGPNGLQVPGADDDAPVRTVVTAVSANAETFRRAIAEGAELLVVHHGLLWGGPPQPYSKPVWPGRGCSSCSTQAWPWPPTTCPWTGTRSSATAPCWPGRSARAQWAS